ncbi:MAG: hypothetical protein ACM3ZR_11860 [Pseudomonadota bacterium]
MIPKEVYGIPFRAVIYPIRDSADNCIGGIRFAKSLENEFFISDSMDGIARAIISSFTEMQEIRNSVAI